MSDSEKSSHWNSLVDELGVEAAPRPPKPAPVVPPPAPKKRPVAAPAEARPKGNWDEVASVLGVDVPPRPPKPALPVTSGSVTPKPATPRPALPPPAPAAAKHEDLSGDRAEVAPRPARRGDRSREGGGRRAERHDRRGGRDGGRSGRGRHERRSETRGEHSEERGERERYGQPPAEELLADEMVSADFVDDLVSAEEEIEWGEEVSSEAAPRRETDEESRQGRRRRRRRGGRRRREGAERPSPGESRDFDEAAEEREHIDEIVDAIEASPIAEPDEREPLEEAVAAEGLDEKRRRRGRRRRGRRRDSEGAATESSRHEPRAEADSDLDDLDAELPAGREPAAFGALRQEGESTNGDLEAEEDDDVHDDHELRPSHRAIPSWDEAIGVIVSANMEARAKNPHAGGQRGRGRGQRGQGRRS